MGLQGVKFDNALYDDEADVLYLHVGEPIATFDYEETSSGDVLRRDGDGNIVGLTVIGFAERL